MVDETELENNFGQCKITYYNIFLDNVLKVIGIITEGNRPWHYDVTTQRAFGNACARCPFHYTVAMVTVATLQSHHLAVHLEFFQTDYTQIVNHTTACEHGTLTGRFVFGFHGAHNVRHFGSSVSEIDKTHP